MRAKAIMLDGNLQNKVCHTLSNNVSKMTQTLLMVYTGEIPWLYSRI